MADNALAQALSFSPAGSKDKLIKGYTRPQQATLDIPVQTFSQWDSVQLVQAALADLENGQFLNASILCDATGRDDRISATLAARTNGVLSLPLEFEPGVDSAKGQAVADEAEAGWSDMFPESELSRLIRWGRFVGVAPGETVWSTKDTPFGKRWVPKMNVWHPQFCFWNWSWRDYAIVTQTEGIQRMGDSPGRWFTYTPNGRYLAWQTGLIRALAIPFLIRWWAYRDWARYSEKHGMPIFKAIVPKKADEIVKERYFNSLAALGAENTVKCEQDETTGRGYDAALLEPQANTWSGFQGLIEQCNSSIAILLLGQNLTTEVKGGSRSAAEVHERVRADFLRADAVTLSSFLRDSILKPWAAFNFGDPELAPWPRWRTDPPEDRAKTATAVLTIGQALTQLIGVNAPVDQRALLDKYDVPMIDEELWAKQQADAAATAAAAAPPAPAPGSAAAPAAPPPAPGKKPPAKKDAPDTDAAARAELPEEFIAAVEALDITALDEATVGERAKVLAQLAARLDPRNAQAAKDKKDDIPAGHVRGQVFADDLADVAVEAGAAALKVDLDGVLADVKAMTSYDDLRARLKKRLAGMDRGAVAAIIERATMLAHSAGKLAVVESTK